MFNLLIITRILCFEVVNDIRCKLVKGYIAFIIYVIYDYIIKKQINKQIIHVSFFMSCVYCKSIPNF